MVTAMYDIGIISKNINTKENSNESKNKDDVIGSNFEDNNVRDIIFKKISGINHNDISNVNKIID